MVQFNIASREIILKVVYYGPALSGKTTNLQQIHARMDPKTCGRMVSLATRDDRTLFFDFLPVQVKTRGGFNLKIKLFTVPGQVMHVSTRRAVLAQADAIAFICDSQRSMAIANAYSFRDLQRNLGANKIDIKETPLVVQFNKRDLPDVKGLDEIREGWKDSGVQTFPAIAVRGEGVVETFKALIEGLYQSLEHQHDFRRKYQLTANEFLSQVLRSFVREPKAK